jgi:hypothetical protein
MNQPELEALLQQLIAALESSVPHTPGLDALAAHWSAWNAAQDALRDLSAVRTK